MSVRQTVQHSGRGRSHDDAAHYDSGMAEADQNADSSSLFADEEISQHREGIANLKDAG